MNIVYMGTPDFAAVPLQRMVEAGLNVKLVVSMPDRPKGRKMILSPSPVKEKAIELGIPCISPEKLKGNLDALDAVKAAQPDFIVTFAFGKLLRKEFLEIPKYGCLNIHASLLPKYRGAAPIQWAIMDGEEKTGVTIMYMDEGLDSGDILLSEETLIEDKTTTQLAFELAELGSKLLTENIRDIAEGKISPIKQPEESPTAYSVQITKEMGEIDWNSSAFKICRKIKAFNDSPIAWTKLNGEILKIYEAKEHTGKGNAGEVLSCSKAGIEVACGDFSVLLKIIQLPGKKALDAAAFLAGNKIAIGTKLG